MAELSDAEVFGSTPAAPSAAPKELSDTEVFGTGLENIRRKPSRLTTLSIRSPGREQFRRHLSIHRLPPHGLRRRVGNMAIFPRNRGRKARRFPRAP